MDDTTTPTATSTEVLPARRLSEPCLSLPALKEGLAYFGLPSILEYEHLPLPKGTYITSTRSLLSLMNEKDKMARDCHDLRERLRDKDAIIARLSNGQLAVDPNSLPGPNDRLDIPTHGYLVKVLKRNIDLVASSDKLGAVNSSLAAQVDGLKGQVSALKEQLAKRRRVNRRNAAPTVVIKDEIEGKDKSGMNWERHVNTEEQDLALIAALREHFEKQVVSPFDCMMYTDAVRRQEARHPERQRESPVMMTDSDKRAEDAIIQRLMTNNYRRHVMDNGEEWRRDKAAGRSAEDVRIDDAVDREAKQYAMDKWRKANDKVNREEIGESEGEEDCRGNENYMGRVRSGWNGDSEHL